MPVTEVTCLCGNKVKIDLNSCIADKTIENTIELICNHCGETITVNLNSIN